jgi:hypothetical protein
MGDQIDKLKTNMGIKAVVLRHDDHDQEIIGVYKILHFVILVYINGLLTDREVCTVKYQTEVFLVWTERRRSEVHALKNRGLIFHSTDRTSEVNNRFIIWLN